MWNLHRVHSNFNFRFVFIKYFFNITQTQSESFYIVNITCRYPVKSFKDSFLIILADTDTIVFKRYKLFPFL